MLLFLFQIFIIGLCSVIFVQENNKYFKFLSLFLSSFTFLYALKLLVLFDLSNYYFQFILRALINFNFFNVQIVFGLDSISLLFFLLSTFLIFLCIIFILGEKRFKFYSLNLLILNFLLLLIFSILDIFLFYIFFEAILIPMFLILGLWGSRDRKIWAIYMLFFYTLCGSLLMLLGILYIYSCVGTFSLEYILLFSFSDVEQYFLWLAFFLSFASKIPIFPLHIWLPEAHVEAPTVGSVILAGVLLKLGVFGFLRFSLALFPKASLYFVPFVYSLCVMGVLYASFTALRQLDLKRIVAYSSVAHMNLIVLGLFSFNFCGLEGALFQSLSHGFVSSALFFLVGMLYSRYHTRSLYYYSGLVTTMPLFCFFLFFFTLANIALPGTSSFIGEFLILLGSFQLNFKATFLAAFSVIISGSYSLWVYNRIAFGNIKYVYLNSYMDLNLREFCILLPLFFLTLCLGIFSLTCFNFFHSSCINLLLLNFF